MPCVLSRPGLSLRDLPLTIALQRSRCRLLACSQKIRFLKASSRRSDWPTEGRRAAEHGKPLQTFGRCRWSTALEFLSLFAVLVKATWRQSRGTLATLHLQEWQDAPPGHKIPQGNDAFARARIHLISKRRPRKTRQADKTFRGGTESGLTATWKSMRHRCKQPEQRVTRIKVRKVVSNGESHLAEQQRCRRLERRGNETDLWLHGAKRHRRKDRPFRRVPRVWISVEMRFVKPSLKNQEREKPKRTHRKLPSRSRNQGPGSIWYVSV